MPTRDLTDDPPSPWLKIVLKDTEVDPLDGTDIPIQVVARRFKSSSVDCDEFIHNPLGYLMDAQKNDGILDEVVLTTDWKVTTHIVNHHRTLRATHLYALVSANGNESTVGIQLHKKES